MKKCLLILLLISGTVFSTKIFAQQVYSDSTQLKISDLEDRITDLESTNSELSGLVEAQKKHIAKIDSQLTVNQANIQHIADSLNITVSKVSDVDKQTQTQITGLNQSLSAKSRYWLMGILGLALISLIVFLVLRKKMTSSEAKLDSQITQTKDQITQTKETLDSQISQTNEAIISESQKVDSKLSEIEKSTELVDSKLEEIQKSNVSLQYESILLGSKLGEISKTTEAMQLEAVKHDAEMVVALKAQMDTLKKELAGKGDKEKIDHKLAKKIGDEVYRMKKRVEILPRKMKGISVLKNSLYKLELEFLDAGYSIEEMLGEKYNPETKAEAKFIDNPELNEGQEIITDIIRPQISYKKEVIQTAKVEVSRPPSLVLIVETPEKPEKTEKAAKTEKADQASKAEKAKETAKADKPKKKPEA